MKQGKLIRQDLGQGRLKLEFLNMIDEEFDFPDDLPSDLKEVTIDLGQMSYMNSMGLRHWVLWVADVVKRHPSARLVISRPPLAFVRSVEVFAEALPGKAVVPDFYLDLYCESCSHEESRLLENKRGLKLPEITCPQCGATLESELPPEAYDVVLRQAP